jgi:hypothetical protein
VSTLRSFRLFRSHRTATRVGFLDESEGVRSSTRLFGLILLALTAVLVATIPLYVVLAFRCKVEISALVIGAIVGGIAPLVVQGLVAIAKRNGSDDGPDHGQPGGAA